MRIKEYKAMKNITKCLICDRINEIKEGKNSCFVVELSSGYVVFGDHQFYKGYALFLSRIHANELHDLDREIKENFLREMSIVAEAVFRVFQPIKMNYELLGNKDSHMHWHLYPRHVDDPDINRPIWSYPKDKRCNRATEVDESFTETYKPLLKKQIETLLKSQGKKV